MQQTAWRRMRGWATAHAVDDFYQGLVPAAVPYFVLDRHLSYTAAAGLALAATLGSALPQPVVGVLADRHHWPWLAPVGVTLAGVGAGLSGLAPTYPMVFATLLLSGVGVAMFHPPAGRDARVAAGESASAMGVFAAGGSVGFFVAPALATPALEHAGLAATVWFLPPAVLTGLVLLRRHGGGSHRAPTHADGTDRPGQFAVLTGVEVVRSTISFGTNTFVALYWIRHLGASSALGGTALTLELGGGVLGTLLGGWLADRIGTVRTVRLGNVLVLPALLSLLASRDPVTALPVVLVLGLVTNIPFAVLIRLGQDYLPQRPGTAAGVTLGLAVSAGGLLMPALGVVADRAGPASPFAVLAAVSVVAAALSWGLRDPVRRPVIRSTM